MVGLARLEETLRPWKVGPGVASRIHTAGPVLLIAYPMLITSTNHQQPNVQISTQLQLSPTHLHKLLTTVGPTIFVPIDRNPALKRISYFVRFMAPVSF